MTLPKFVVFCLVFFSFQTVVAKPMKTPRIPASVKSWGYQLQKIKPKQIAKSSFDMVVIDFSKDGSGRKMFSKAAVKKMQKKADGSRRLVLAYLSIGEAENYRDYWRKKWNRAKPRWIGKENPSWKGNFLVRYWYEEWQDLIFGAPNAYLDRIMEAGFDGVYLDRVDSYQEFSKKRPMAAEDMISFVSKIARYANKKRKFYVMGQNAEGLAVHKAYTNAISAIGKEDLLYGIDHNGAKNNKDEVFWSHKYLKKAQAAGLPIFVVEYLKSKKVRAKVRKKLKTFNMIPYFGKRDLSKLNY